eukprot:755997-Hanusia_phi.AAC.1
MSLEAMKLKQKIPDPRGAIPVTGLPKENSSPPSQYNRSTSGGSSDVSGLASGIQYRFTKHHYGIQTALISVSRKEKVAHPPDIMHKSIQLLLLLRTSLLRLSPSYHAFTKHPRVHTLVCLPLEAFAAFLGAAWDL